MCQGILRAAQEGQCVLQPNSQHTSEHMGNHKSAESLLLDVLFPNDSVGNASARDLPSK